MIKTILITGSTDGIGKKTAELLAKMGHKIIIHGRNLNKCLSTVEEVKSISGNMSVDFFVSDLSSFSSIKNGAEELKNRYSKLDVLINNAGIYAKEKRLTEDGFESTFAVNHLSVYLLTGLLLPLLKNSSPSRIINVSSVAHERAKFNIDDINLEGGYNHYIAYANSKLANILFTNYLANLLPANYITVNSLHPGVITTKLLKEGFGISGSSLEEGASTSVYLATSEDINNITGKYFVKKAIAKMSKTAEDLNLAKELWNLSEKITDFKYPL
ncbi:MAG TPA: SDR family oxidoreductase [Melioribacteraceae bacterium]|nr:SDR family oxidoreductase [Melioribacteraceae bacterium]